MKSYTFWTLASLAGAIGAAFLLSSASSSKREKPLQKPNSKKIFSRKSSTLQKIVQKNVDLWLAFSGEEQGNLAPCGCSEGLLGGLMRRDSLLQFLRKCTPVLPVAMGDWLERPNRHGQIKLKYLQQAASKMRYSLACLGELDLALWKARLSLPVPRPLAANVFTGAKPLFSSYRVVEVSQKRLGFIGVLGKEFLPDTIALGLELKDPLQVSAKVAQRLRPQVDFLILLWHGTPPSNPPTWADLTVGGHRSEKFFFDSKKKLLRTVQKAKGVALIGLRFLEDEVRMERFQEGYLDDFVPDSPRMLRLYRRYVQEVAQAGLSIEKERRFAQGVFYVGSQRCLACHSYAANVWKNSAHAHAFATLKQKGQHKNPDCLTCHTVGYRYYTGYENEQLTSHLKNVGCESCHGPGSEHVRLPQKGYGRTRGKATCLLCHTPDNSPKFRFSQYYPKIRHSSP
ncbi:MAG: hypothetical protein D6805_05740 [Planctomycetota bacterium]|nr:MAG: hypothetical protein D6805_05740 [Planctomycetota bacterium]